jgi:type I restriction enzyme, S subunit
MRSEVARWPSRRIGDVADVNPDSTRGLSADSLIRYIDIASVDASYTIASDIPEVPIADAPSRARRLIREGDILFSMVRSERRAFAVVPGRYDGHVASTGFAVLRARPREVDPGFLWGAVRDPRFVSHIVSRQRGSNYPAVTARDVADTPVSLPPLREQRRIARILGALDDTIENNRGIAATLEQIAATLFKARFVDFVDHDDLVESEMGRIPRGWGVQSVYDVATVTYGRPFKSELFSEREGVPLLRIRDLARHEPSVRTPEHREDGRLVTAGDVVVGMDGEFRAHCWWGPDAWLNQRVCVFDPRKGVSRVFILEAIKRPLAFYEATKSGTTVIHLGKRDIDTFRVVRPPDSVMRAFRDHADPLLEAAVAARRRCRTLEAIRDALLPRLISGQIRVPPDAFEDTEAA